MTATTVPAPTVARRAALGAAGGALWALSPIAWAVADPRTQDPGTPSGVAVLATSWAVAVLGPLLVVAGLSALRSSLGAAAGRAGTTGIVLAGLGTSAVALGNGIELVSLSARSGTSVAGYVVFYAGFLVGFAGALLVGRTVLRHRRDDASRIAGWLMVLAVPLCVGIVALGAVLAPEGEVGFSAGVAVPTGVSWLLLGRSLARGPKVR